MTIQTFSAGSLKKIRQYIAHGLVIPDVNAFSPRINEFDAFEDIPMPDSLDALGGVFDMGGLADFQSTLNQRNEEAWVISLVNPGDVLYKLPGVTLKSKLRLVGFVFQGDSDGRGIVWAVPEEFCTTDHLEKALLTAKGLDYPPHPLDALPDFMGAIEGDRSATSFFIASILRRELLEFGAKGALQNWTHHHFIDHVPEQIKPFWGDRNPQNLQPKFSQYPDGRAAIEFFTCRVKPPIMIMRHVDQYPPDAYTARSTQRVLVKLKAQ